MLADRRRPCEASDVARERREETFQLFGVEAAVRADAAAHVEAEGTDGLDRPGDVLRAQAAREEDRRGRGFDDAAADAPVVRAPRPAQLFDGQALVARVEQQRVNVSRYAHGFRERLLAGDVDDLHDRDAGELCAQLAVDLDGHAVAELQGVHAAAPLLLDDGGRVLPARQKERRHRGRRARRYLGYQILFDDARPA